VLKISLHLRRLAVLLCASTLLVASTRQEPGQTVWQLTFEERARPTIIRTSRAEDVPASGSIWVDPASGHVAKTEMNVAGFLSGAEDSTGTRFTIEAHQPPS
jgi:hypothetical protein